jgi:effector-binding domain-containing protein
MGRIEKIEVVQQESFPILSMREVVNAQEIAPALGRMYGTIMPYVAQSGLSMAPGRYPMAIYHTWESETHKTDMEAVIPVNAAGKSANGITARMLEGGTMINATYYGPYEQSEMAHTAVHEYAKEHKHNIEWVAWEVYVTDPQSEPDQNKWLTEVYYRIK